MKSKLTLTVEEKLIERAKRRARERGTSVSDLVEKYFSLLEGEVAPETKSKQGGIAPSPAPSAAWRQGRSWTNRIIAVTSKKSISSPRARSF
jgi:hypothetical protein